VERLTRFVVVQVRQALQHAGASGAYSAARLVMGAALTLNWRSTDEAYVWIAVARRSSVRRRPLRMGLSLPR
jgi:hypothetical protein